MNKEKNGAVLRTAVKYLLIAAGSLIYAAGFQFFLFPNEIVSGGVTGVAMIVNAFTGWPVGVMIIVMNLPLFAVSWRHFGLPFLLSSFAGMLLSSVFMDVFALLGIVVTDDAMLAAIIGGVVKGAGLGLVYWTGATGGGIDIVAKILRERFSQINFGTLLLVLDAVIIIAYALILGQYQSAMYSLISMFVVSRVVDLFLYGIDNSALCYIISEQSGKLTESILSGAVHRGVTILEGEGAYSHRQKHVILCVVKRHQIPELRRLVRGVDEHAFFIVTDAKNVFGKGFESISEVR